MSVNENNLSAFRLFENVKEHVARGRNELIELGKKNLLSFGNIDSYTKVVEKGLENLAVEVCGLEAKLRIITKERDELRVEFSLDFLEFTFFGAGKELVSRPTLLKID